MRVDAFVKHAADCHDHELASLGVSVLLQWTEAQNDGEALHRAAESADLAEARRLVAEDGASVDARDDVGQRPLHLAFARLLSADDGDAPPSSAVLEMVRFLLGMGAEPCATDITGQQPLHACAMAGLVAAGMLLVEHGASLGAVDSDGERLMRLAVGCGVRPHTRRPPSLSHPQPYSP